MSANHPRNAFVIEDEPLLRWALAERLRDHGYSVTEAADGTAARSAIASVTTPPSVIFLDLHLPQVCELELLDELHERTPASRIVLMSAEMTSDIAASAYDHGAAAALAKPFDLDSAIAIGD